MSQMALDAARDLLRSHGLSATAEIIRVDEEGGGTLHQLCVDVSPSFAAEMTDQLLVSLIKADLLGDYWVSYLGTRLQ